MSPGPSAQKNPTWAILLLDDEVANLDFYALSLASDGLTHVIPCSKAGEAFAALASQRISVLLLDLFMPEMPGQKVLDLLTREHPDVPVVVITADDDVATAVDCMRRGAVDFAVKPLSRASLITVVRRALEESAQDGTGMLSGPCGPAEPLKRPEVFSAMITSNAAMRSLFAYVERVSVTSQPVLITGETGVGKELMARTVHDAGMRKGDFVAVNVASLDDTSFSDTLFGHKRGAFTGADRDRRGLIEKAAGGTLFLDEIGDLSAASQVKLLRLLQEREFYPLGSDTPSTSDARVVVATSHSPDDLLKSPGFRTDLYYRLHAHHVHIPALRERRDDLPALLAHFMTLAAQELKKPVPEISAGTRQFLQAYPFPGNLRELGAMVLDAMSRHTGGALTAAHFASLAIEARTAGPDVSAPPAAVATTEQDSAVIETLSDLETLHIEKAIRTTGGNLSHAAALLGISRQTLHRKLKQKSKGPSSDSTCDASRDTQSGAL